METLAVVKEIVIILLLIGAFGLCIIVAVGLLKLFPHLQRWAENLANTAEATSKITGDFAAVSADVAGDVRKTAASASVGAEQLANTAASTAKITGDFAAVSTDVAGDIRETAASMAQWAGDFAQTGRNVMESSAHLRTAMQLLELLGPAGKAVNFANMGISRIPEMVRRIFQR